MINKTLFWEGSQGPPGPPATDVHVEHCAKMPSWNPAEGLKSSLCSTLQATLWYRAACIREKDCCFLFSTEALLPACQSHTPARLQPPRGTPFSNLYHDGIRTNRGSGDLRDNDKRKSFQNAEQGAWQMRWPRNLLFCADRESLAILSQRTDHRVRPVTGPCFPFSPFPPVLIVVSFFLLHHCILSTSGGAEMTWPCSV